MQACRNNITSLTSLDLSNAGHAGLLLDRYLAVTVKDKDSHPKSRKHLHEAARKATTNHAGLYQLAFDRWKKTVPQKTSQRLHVQGRLIVGLGGDNILETGLTLHHTYGVPIIPGSALKGLAAHYAHRIWGGAPDGKQWQKEAGHHKTLFGTQDDAGHILFHDAWITPETLTCDPATGLVTDVMTPHHGDYYSKKKFEHGPKADTWIPPTDFDDPNPITFLSVSGSFLVAVSCDVPGEEGDKWAELALSLLTNALREWGVGGKTSSGYGRLDIKPLVVVESQHSSHTGHKTTSNRTGHGGYSRATQPKQPDVAPKADAKTIVKRIDRFLADSTCNQVIAQQLLHEISILGIDPEQSNKWKKRMRSLKSIVGEA